MKKVLLSAVILAAVAASVWADHPRADQMKHVKKAAHNLAKAAHHVYDSAGRGHGHVHGAEAAALDGLRDLGRDADDFHHQVERYYGDPAHTDADFRHLVDSYYRVRGRLHDLGDHHVMDDFAHVDEHMHALMDYYGGRGVWEAERHR